MSIEQLKADLKDNLATVKGMDPATATPADIVRHLKDTLWPTIEALVDETGEMDESIAEVADMMDGNAEFLSEETGQVFAGIITAGLALAGELDKLVIPSDLKQAIVEFRKLCKQGAETLDEIVLPDSDDAEGAEADDDNEDEGDDE